MMLKVSHKALAFAIAMALLLSAIGLAFNVLNVNSVSAQYVPEATGPSGTGGNVDANGDPEVVIATKIKILVPEGGQLVVREGDAFARLLPPPNVGNRSVIDIPYIRAADVFVFYRGASFKGDFAEGLSLCLRGSGSILFASVKGAPRQFFPNVTLSNARPRFTCTTIFNPGTVALVAR